MYTDNEKTDEHLNEDNKPCAVTLLREEYLNFSAEIVALAKYNKRPLFAEEAKTIRELARAIKDLDKVYKPQRGRRIVVIPPRLSAAMEEEIENSILAENPHLTREKLRKF